MTPEDMFAQKQDWAEDKARKRHSKHKAFLPPHLCPSLDEYTNYALAGLWIACKEWDESKSIFDVFAYGKISNQFDALRREYARYETNKDNFEHGSSNDVDRIVDKQRSK